MLSRSSWLHLRIPFSYFLLPVFLFSLAISPNLNASGILWVFIIVHIFLYPASNGYNSYFDKDEKSIGGLKNPPPVNKGLYFLALLFDGVAIVLGYLKVNGLFAIMLLIYGLISKAYSHPSIRLKKLPVLGWLTAGLFQGFFTFLMCYIGVNKFSFENALHTHVLIPAALCSMMLWGNYPMTQVYQHEEDAKRGDQTLSLKLGIRGTFVFTAIVFSAAVVGFIFYFLEFFEVKYAYAFMLALTPVLSYFLFWFLKVIKDERNANFSYTMGLNFISSTCLNTFFIYLFLESSQVLQALKAGY
ncbi:MAG TPA: UbiA family prenyltransferase [Cyclobacteriaceae bacterium]|nr:UbiA family prenyltransferase [Cyclobacteriaceae bacterium]